MRRLILTALFLFLTVPAFAQTEDEASLYQVSDIPVDVAADTAAHARDQAILQAQHNALKQLLTRLGADSNLEQKLDDNAIASMVQAFEVQQEKVSAVRYIGTFTVRFKPMKVREFLGKRGASFSESRSKPAIILPIINNGTRSLLWEERTPWRSAWENVSGKDGIVPIVVPTGEMEDIATVSATEAMSGKQEAFQNLMNKYQSDTIVVAVLNVDPEKLDPKKSIKLDIQRYDSNGKNGEAESLTLAPAGDLRTLAASMSDGIKQTRSLIENSWRQAAKTSTAKIASGKGPLAHLPVNIPIASLAEWNDIRSRLTSVSAVSRTNVLSLTRGNADIELDFYGEIPQLQTALAQQNLYLEQSPSTGSWMIVEGNGQGR